MCSSEPWSVHEGRNEVIMLVKKSKWEAESKSRK